MTDYQNHPNSNPHHHIVNPGPRIPEQCWVYRARLDRVIDGDTLDLVIDQSLHTARTERVRLLGVNTPEVHGATRSAGLEAAGWTRSWLAGLPSDWPLVVQTEKDDAFGRWLATVWRSVDGACLNDALLRSGQAVEFRR